MIDPIELARRTEEIVARESEGAQLRKYYRFRLDRWYGGVATADAVGCNLRCAFCWSWRYVTRPDAHGEFYSPQQVARRLMGMARSKGIPRVRVSGAEPTIGREHLLALLERTSDSGLLFILETNGILIGADESYAEDLSRFRHVHVRVSLKGCTPEEFSRLTGAAPRFFEYQLRALENLLEHGASFHPSVMLGFSTEKSLLNLVDRLREIDESLPSRLEPELLILYPAVESRIKRAGLRPTGFVRPGEA